MHDLEQYEKTELRLNVVAANIAANVLGAVFFGVFFAAVLFHPGFQEQGLWNLLFIPLVIVFLIVFHEGLHAYSLVRWGGLDFRKDIKFGIKWKRAMAYCHPKVPVGMRTFRITLLFPLWVTGFIGLLLVFLYPTILSAVFASMAFTACTGDVWVFIKARGFPEGSLVLDHPSEPGADIYLPRAGHGA